MTTHVNARKLTPYRAISNFSARIPDSQSWREPPPMAVEGTTWHCQKYYSEFSNGGLSKSLIRGFQTSSLAKPSRTNSRARTSLIISVVDPMSKLVRYQSTAIHSQRIDWVYWKPTRILETMLGSLLHATSCQKRNGGVDVPLHIFE